MTVQDIATPVLIDWNGLRARGITLSRPSIYRLMAANKFPKQVKQGERKIAWVASEIDEFINSAIAKRD